MLYMNSLHSAVDYQSTEWLLHVNIDTIDAQSDLCFHVTVNKARQAKKANKVDQKSVDGL